MRIGFELVKAAKQQRSSRRETRCDARVRFVCARRMSGLDRPGIAVTMPTLVPGLLACRRGIGECVLFGYGRNVDVRPQTLAQFAIPGAQFAKLRASSPRLRPRVGLLSNGEEASKGTPILRETHAL